MSPLIPLLLATAVVAANCQFSPVLPPGGPPGPFGPPPPPPPPFPPRPWPPGPCPPPPPCPPGPGPCPPPPGPPAFLCNVTGNAAHQFMQIVMNPNDTKAAIKTNLQNWAQTNGVADAYANFTNQEQQMAQRFHDNVTANLAGQALQLFNQIWSIRQNDTITRIAECQQLQSALNGTDPLVFHLVPLPPPAIPGPAPRPCHPPRPPHLGPKGMGGNSEGSASMLDED